MRLLSVAERELRAAARHRWLYLRWLTALGAFVLLIWLAWVYDLFENRSAGPQVFHTFAVVVFVNCLFVGAAGTADCLSRERREGTLGLLFLTNLNSVEIVAGKVFSNGLALFYSLLALFPILALPVLIGGITFGEFWRTVLALLAALFFAMAAGFSASSVCVRQFPAIALATGMTLAWALGLVALAEALRRLGFSRVSSQQVAMFSPLQTLLSAAESARGLRLSQYWLSLAAVFGLALVSLALTAWRSARSWRDRPKPERWWRRLAFHHNWRERSRAARTALRARLLGINPFFWLASRQRVSAPVFMLLTLLLVLVTVGLTGPYFSKKFPAGTISPLVGHLFAWFWTGLAVHGLVLYYGATAASQRLAEDKQTGALELLLSTPASYRTISRGLWLAYGRRMFFPALIAVLIHGYFIWQVLNLMLLDPPAGRIAAHTTAAQIFWSAIFELPVHGKMLNWQFGFILRGLLFALVALMANWLMLGWVGRWLGLRMKHPGFAPMVAVVLALVPPVLLFSLLCYVFDQWHLFRMPERQFMPLMMWIAFGIALGNCLLLSSWAALRLRNDFRTTVTSRYEPPAPRLWGRFLWRIVVRATLVSLALGLTVALVVLGIYGYQNWRGRQRWAAFQAQLKLNGESLEIQARLPGPVPDKLNFARTPGFLALLNRTNDGITRLLERMNQFNVGGPAFANTPVATEWTRQMFTPLDNHVKWAITNSSRAAGTNRSDLALALVQGLAGETRALRTLAEASRLPCFQTSTNRDARVVLKAEAAELVTLDRLQLLYRVRACAFLAVDRPADAGEDLLAGLRLARLERQSLDSQSSLRVQVALMRLLQPLWEGLAAHQWNASQLESVQAELAQFNLLADHTNTIQRVVLAYVESWRAAAGSAAAQERLNSSGNDYHSAWQPRAWWLDNCVQLYQAGQSAIARVDFAAGRVKDDFDWSDLNGLPVDPIATQLFQQGAWWGNNPASVSFAQTAVNQAILACALERYRLARGVYPETLDALVPAYLNSIPRDTSRGRPMFYERVGQGSYALRGAGPDGNIAQGMATSDDWLWSLAPVTNAVSPALQKKRSSAGRVQ